MSGLSAVIRACRLQGIKIERIDAIPKPPIREEVRLHPCPGGKDHDAFAQHDGIDVLVWCRRGCDCHSILFDPRPVVTSVEDAVMVDRLLDVIFALLGHIRRLEKAS